MANQQKPAVAAAEPTPAAEPELTGKIVLISTTGQARLRGTYVVSNTPIVLDLATMAPTDLAEIMGDDRILKLRTDTPLTPVAEVQRFKR